MSLWLRLKLKFGKLIGWDKGNVKPFFGCLVYLLFLFGPFCAYPAYVALTDNSTTPAPSVGPFTDCEREQLVERLVNEVLDITPVPAPTPCPSPTLTASQ